MSSWTEPVWNRTQADVAYAIGLNNKINRVGWEGLTPQEQESWTAGLLGCLNTGDLSRIEQNTAFLSAMLNERYYRQEISSKNTWAIQDLPTSAEMERIRGNIQILIEAYNPVEIPLPASLEKPDYRTINTVERVLKLMKDMISRMEKEYRYSGAFAAGQDIVL